MQPEGLLVPAHQFHGVRINFPAQGASSRRGDDKAGVDRVLGYRRVVQKLFVLVELGHGLFIELESLDSGPPGGSDLIVAVDLGVDSHGRGLDAHRQVLGHQCYGKALIQQVLGDREYACVVIPGAHAHRQDIGCNIVQFNAQRSTGFGHWDRLGQSPMAGYQVIKQTKGLTGEETQIRILALVFQLDDDSQRDHYMMLIETEHGFRIRKQDRSINNVGSYTLFGSSVHGSAPILGSGVGTLPTRKWGIPTPDVQGDSGSCTGWRCNWSCYCGTLRSAGACCPGLMITIDLQTLLEDYVQVTIS